MLTYKITKITDRNGVEKTDFYNELQQVHPEMIGQIIYPKLLSVGYCFLLVWSDDTCRILCTSRIQEIKREDTILKIITENSIYLLERVWNCE